MSCDGPGGFLKESGATGYAQGGEHCYGSLEDVYKRQLLLFPKFILSIIPTSGILQISVSNTPMWYILAVKSQSVLYGKKVDRSAVIVYSPLNGTGLQPVTDTLKAAGYTKVFVVKEQEKHDGTFPTCPYPNPEIPEEMCIRDREHAVW